MKFTHKKQLLFGVGSVATIAATAALVTGGTLGLFSSGSVSQTNKYTSGTVSLTKSATAACTISTMVPGDKSTGYVTSTPHRTDPTDTPCTFTVKYTGSVPSYLGLSVAVAGTKGPTTTPHVTGLYTGTSGTGLKLNITDSSTTAYTLSGLTAATSSTDNLLVSTTPVAPNTTYKFTVNFALPRAMTNKYQGAKSTLKLTVAAVQAGNNKPTTGTCTTAGKTCTGISWS